MIACRAEPFAEAVNDIVPLIDEHWREVGSFADRFARHIHFEEYHKLDSQSRLLAVTARDHGRLVGYFVGALGLDLHRVTLTEPHRRIPVISALVYYIHPDYRGYGRMLIRATEREAVRRVGVQIINIRVKPGMNGAGEFLTAIGYSVTETTYTRLIGEAADAAKRLA